MEELQAAFASVSDFKQRLYGSTADTTQDAAILAFLEQTAGAIERAAGRRLRRGHRLTAGPAA